MTHPNDLDNNLEPLAPHVDWSSAAEMAIEEDGREVEDLKSVAADAVLVLHKGAIRELTGPLASEILRLWEQLPHKELESAMPKGGAS